MANRITNTRVNDQILRMSNALTAVFIETFCLAGASLAKEQFQKDVMIWFGQRDWFILGTGAESFDISDIIWDTGIFSAQKKFVQSVIDNCYKRSKWELLSYEPNAELLFNKLREFEKMIHLFCMEHIQKQDQKETIIQFDGIIKKYDTCEKHQIFKHWHGCVICNHEF